MLPKSERERIIALMNREVVPAIGCTEPIAVALCTARATEELGRCPEHIDVRLSANILKNAMGVGIPGTGGMIGLPIAVALGALVGKSEYQLEVLRDVTPETVERGKAYIDCKCIAIALKEGIDEKLYIEVEVSAAGHTATAIIAGGHTRFVYVARDGATTLDKRTPATTEAEEEQIDLSLARVWEFATTTPVEELRFVLESRRLNKTAAEQSLKCEYGHSVGRTLRRERELKVMGDSIFSRILAYTSAACDARMAGAMIPVMSNSGSGNQGIDPSGGGLCRTDRCYRRSDHPGADTEPSDRHLHQTKSGSSLGIMRVRRGGDRFELRHHLSDGRRLRPHRRSGEEHDRKSDRHDLRRRETELRDEVDERRIDRRIVGDDGDGRPLRNAVRGYHRPRRRPLHPQSDTHRTRWHERNRPHGARHHDRQALIGLRWSPKSEGRQT